MRAVLFAAIAALTLTAAPAAAQQAVPETGGRVYALVGGGFGDGTFIGTGVGAGLRLTRHLGVDVELTQLSTRDDYATRMPWLDVPVVSAVSALAVAEDFPPAGADDYLFPSISFEEQGRDLTTFLTKFTVEFPIADGRLFSYLTGGGGIGRVTERFGVFVDPIPVVPSGARAGYRSGRWFRRRGSLPSRRSPLAGGRVLRARPEPGARAAASMSVCGGGSVLASTSGGCVSSGATAQSTPRR